jgi:hypothetical protein
MELGDVPEEVELLTRRHAILSALGPGAVDRTTLAETLEHSPSTIDRATTELEAAGYVEHTDHGYVQTQAGRLALERYEAFVTDQRQLLDARELLTTLPSDCDLPTSALSDASVETFEGTDQLFDALDSLLDGVDRYRLLLPPGGDSRHLERARSHAEAGTDVELIVPEAVLDDADGSVSETRSFITTATASGGYGLLLWTPPGGGAETSSLAVLCYDDGPVGMFSTADTGAREWALEVLDVQRDSGTATARTDEN